MELLIVDDERQLREGLKNTINWKNIGINQVKIAFNGIQAIKILEQNDIDIIISDIKMPGLDGLELAKWVYNNHPDIRVIIISGYSEFEYAQKAVRYRVNNYLLKPVVIEQLLKNVTDIIEEIDKEKEINYQNKILKEKYKELKETVIINELGLDDTYNNSLEKKTNAKLIMVEDIKKYVNEHYLEEININIISTVIKKSPNYISRTFKEITNVNFTDYLNKLRIKEAKRLLKNSNKTLYCVAKETGYNDSRYFIRKFKEIIGLTPTEYRNLFSD